MAIVRPVVENSRRSFPLSLLYFYSHRIYGNCRMTVCKMRSCRNKMREKHFATNTFNFLVQRSAPKFTHAEATVVSGYYFSSKDHPKSLSRMFTARRTLNSLSWVTLPSRALQTVGHCFIQPGGQKLDQSAVSKQVAVVSDSYEG